jgi:hypothetical protein
LASNSTSQFEITVVTGAEGGGADLAREAEIVKAALLYADHVTLTSPKAALLQAAFDLLDGPERVRQDRLLELAAALMDPQSAALMATLKGRPGRPRTPAQIALDQQLRAHLKPHLGEVEKVIDGFRGAPGVSDVRRAQAAGALSLNTLGLQPVPTIIDSLMLASGNRKRGQSRVDIADRLLKEITRSVAPAATSYPMFDEQAGGLLGSMIEEGLLPGVDLKPATHAHLAGHLIGSLEAFPDAPVDGLLDVRRALGDPLIRFRGAVTAMTRELDSTPLDAGFARAADEVYRERVAPELLALEESFREGRVREQLWRQVTAGAGFPGLKRAVAMGFAAYAVLPEITVVAGAAGIGVADAMADLAAAILKRRQELADQRRTNKFLFLYEAGRRLS